LVTSQTTPARRAGPSSLSWAIGVILVETAAVGVVTVLLAISAATQDSVSTSSAVAAVLFPLLLALVLGLLGWQLRRRRAWARSPTIVLEMLMLPIGYFMITGGVPWFGVPVMLFGFAGAALLLAPSSRAALGIG
jgi:predicted lysophospholipase L1 biosynthesis ABC-type transport system permease subunit